MGEVQAQASGIHAKGLLFPAGLRLLALLLELGLVMCIFLMCLLVYLKFHVGYVIGQLLRSFVMH